MIRRETASDESAVNAVQMAAFPTDSEARLVDGLRSSGDLAVSLVFERPSGSVVGHIAFSPVKIDPPAGVTGVGLAPVAVLPGFQSQGIGSQLIRRGLDACRDIGAEFVVVLGEPAYYGRFGFVAASSRGLGNEYGVDDPFMVFELKSGCLSGIQGTVRYCGAFANL